MSLFWLWVLTSCGGTEVEVVGAGDVVPEVTSGGEIVWGETRGRLVAESIDEEGYAHAAYRVNLTEGQWVRFGARSESADATITVTGPNDFRVQNDDFFPGDLSAWVQFVARVSGEYTINVSTVRLRQLGDFQLIARVLPDGFGETLAVPVDRPSVLSASSDPDFGSRQVFRIDGQGGAVLRIRLNSTVFDTTALLVGPSGQHWWNDDAHELVTGTDERALDSTLVVPLPESGRYMLFVGSYDSRSAGPFRLRTSSRAPVIVPEGQLVASGGFAGPNGSGRVYGVFGGVTIYPSGLLYGCADDARFLAQAMRSARLQRVDEQVILADREATADAFLGGIRQIASRAGPEDVVVVFWSGHGTMVPTETPDPHDLDGTNETIVLLDRGITDNELVAALDTIRAGTVILALDSCHSGGFAEDFLTRPGRMGLFSSDEDVLSSTAQPRRAGGYLSYHLRQAVLGHADHKPHDGVLLAGELVDSLAAGYVADYDVMNPAEDVTSFQHFVMRRTGLPWSQPLWLYPRNPQLELFPIPDTRLDSPPPIGGSL